VKVLHIASFIGNIGDNASHIGLYNILNTLLCEYSIHQIEIRKFYKNYNRSDKQFFDQDFIIYINTFDVVIIGGGGFLDYWVPDSQTGTTLDIAPSLLQSITVPLLITSVGCVPHKEVPVGNVTKFREFLDAVKHNKKIKIAVRTDGSVDSLHEDIGQHYLTNIPEVLDSGFFYDVKDGNVFPIDKSYVAINITYDQILMKNKQSYDLDQNVYYAELVKTLVHIIEVEKLHIVFVPHIYSDLMAISCLLNEMDDYYIRNNISIAPCIQENNGADYLFSIYKYSQLVLGTRYHANICSLAMGRPVIGLAALDRVSYVYKYIGASEDCIALVGNFSFDLCRKISRILKERDTSSRSHNIDYLKTRTLNVYRDIFRQFGFIVKDESK
jgi:polysaccharide pyruvyl transferase WcaK-like protein